MDFQSFQDLSWIYSRHFFLLHVFAENCYRLKHFPISSSFSFHFSVQISCCFEYYVLLPQNNGILNWPPNEWMYRRCTVQNFSPFLRGLNFRRLLTAEEESVASGKRSQKPFRWNFHPPNSAQQQLVPLDSLYSSLPNIRPGRLIIFEENPHRVTLIWKGCLFNFEQNFHWVSK